MSRATLGKTVRAERKKRGWTQQTVSTLTGIDVRRLSALELEKRTPSSHELQAFIRHGLLKEGRRKPSRVKLQHRSTWMERPVIYTPKSARSLQARIVAAKTRYGSWVNLLLWRLGQGESRRHREEFLEQACLESGTELTFWLELLSRSEPPSRLPPCRVGFRRLPILNPCTMLVQSDVRLPCLEGKLDGLEFLAFPQVTVCAKGRIYRLDALIGFRRGKTKVWMNVEIDGTGHDPSVDSSRERELDLLTIRISDQDLQAKRSMTALREKALELTKWEYPPSSVVSVS